MAEQLSLETVIIVACICGSVVLILTVVLIVLCCSRRRDTKYFYEKAESGVAGRPAIEHSVPSRSSSNKILNISACSLNSPASAAVDRSTQNSPADPTALRKVQNTDNNHDTSCSNMMTNESRAHSTEKDDVINASVTSESQRPRKIIYEVVV